MAVQSRADTVTFDFLYGRLLQEATQRQASSPSSEQNQQPLSAMAVGLGFRPSGYTCRGGYRTGNRGFGRGIRAKGPEGVLPLGLGEGPRMAKEGLPAGVTIATRKVIGKMKAVKRKGDLQRNTEGGHSAFKGLGSEQSGKTNWIIDSGGSQYLPANRSLLEDYIDILPRAIKIRNGKDITAIRQGNITIPTTSWSILLSGALHVPDIGRNLISVASIVDQGFWVEFTRTTCAVSRGNTVQGIRKGEGNIYYLSGLQEVALAELSDTSGRTSLEIWLRRIRHRILSPQATTKTKESVNGLESLWTLEQNPTSSGCGI